MFVAKYLALAATALGVVSAGLVQEDWTLALLKRQEPGTSAYACHASCGNAITLSRGSDPCTDEVFLTDYAACLACAGPDNENIWRYYGATLTTAGTKCGLSTTPASAAASEVTTTAASALPSTTTAVESITEEATEPTAAPEATSAVGSSSTTAAVASTSTSAETSSADLITSSPSPTTSAGNTTSTATSVEFTGGANSQRQLFGGLGAVGAAVLAILI